MIKKHSSIMTKCLTVMSIAMTALFGASSLFAQDSPTKASSTPFYGWCISSNNAEKTPSIWQLNAGSAEYLRNVETMDGFSTGKNLVVNSGYMKDNTVYGYVYEYYAGIYVFAVDWVTYDLNTGKILTKEKLKAPFDGTPIFNVLTYVPEDNLMYGVGNLVNLPGFYFMAVSPDDPRTPVKSVEIDMAQYAATSICYNGAEDCFYLINTSRQLVRMQRDGYVETVADITIDNTPNVYSALGWNPNDNKYYWNPIWKDDHSSIVTIDLKTGVTSELFRTPNLNQFSFFMSDKHASLSPMKPQKPEFVGSDFPKGSNNGKVTYRLPSKAIDGSSLSGSLKCYAVLDGTAYGEYNGTPGSELGVSFSNLSAGEHNFLFYVATSEYSSDKISNNLFIGIDTPTAPADVKLEGTTVTWLPVTTSVHGGYVDYANIEYEISLNGEPVGTTKSTEFTVTIPEGAPLSSYYAEIVAIADGKRSEAGKSNSIVAGAPMELPVSIAPTAEEFSLCTTVDGNGDGKKWLYVASEGAFCIGLAADPKIKPDEWLFMPPVNFDDPEAFYNVSFLATTRSSSNPSKENISVCIAKKPEPREAVTLMEEFPLTTNRYEYKEYSTLFQVHDPGTYYIGFH